MLVIIKVIQRRLDGSVDFNRGWESYKLGFGFLSREFWIGNEKLSFLTNQKKYELRIDVTNSNGSSFFVSYNMFRISDEFSSYKLTNLGQYSGTGGEAAVVYVIMHISFTKLVRLFNQYR